MSEAELWAYDEPHPSGGNVHTTMTRRQAIDYQRSIIGHHYPEGVADNILFWDWVAVHWAYRVDAVAVILPNQPENAATGLETQKAAL